MPKTLLIVLLAIAIGAVAIGGNRPVAGQSLRHWRQMASLMVEEEIADAGVTNTRVLRAMRETPRHEFMPTKHRSYAYYDMALPIGSGQTISPPFVVAYMTQELDPQPTDRVLEIGTGSGYQAAVLGSLVRDVYTIEIVESLARRAQRTLKRLDYKNVHTRAGDGFVGWPEAAPFDKIIVTCSPESVPKPLIEQLAEGGRMVVPVGERYQQNLVLFRKEKGELKREALRATLFVPMTGTAEDGRDVLPNPLKPTVVNGSFEVLLADGLLADGISDKQRPTGWHYQRQLTVVNDPSAPDGQHYAHFANLEPGRGCRALQGFAIDGRKISKLKLAFSVRGQNIRPGQSHEQWPLVVITFYDERRGALGEESVGPFDGTFAWRRQSADIAVPLKAREAILRLGLLGAVGSIDFDKVSVQSGSR